MSLIIVCSMAWHGIMCAPQAPPSTLLHSVAASCKVVIINNINNTDLATLVIVVCILQCGWRVQVVPVSPQGNGNDVNAYISLCLGVALSFSAAMSLILLWRWSHHRALEGLPTLGPGRTCTGIEPETVASFPSYRYQEEGGQSVTARAVSVRQTGEAVVTADEGTVERRKSEPVFSSPNLAAAAAEDPIK